MRYAPSCVLLSALLLSLVFAAGAAANEPADDSSPRPTNRLAKETSPYLLMHAHNPVDWYPWGEAALDKAKRENKPIFLSIGYSSCYWCHVMERESFMDPEIASYLNENYVCVKVDREERPDIDEIYMTSVQMMTRHGGWPLSVFLTPEARPFLGGTYFPPRSRDRQVGFLEVITKVHQLWKTRRLDLEQRSEQIAVAIRDYLQRSESPDQDLKIEAAWPDAAQAEIQKSFDHQFGGFGFNAANPRQPKFPESPKLAFLLTRAELGDTAARQMVVKTLDEMARGGIHDHLGGGFHRYSTDRFWWVPHFEKMLYDNGQLASIYSRAFALTGNEAYRTIARDIAGFVAREMTADAGGFYSALDAETHAEEGRFYAWSDAQLTAPLSPADYETVAQVYVWHADELRQTLPPAVQASFNQFFPTGHEPIFEVGHVLMLGRPLDEIATANGTSPHQLGETLGQIRARLLAARSERERPLTDTKILTAWNGLMIRGLADIGRLCDDSTATMAAASAADFVLANLRRPDGRLMRTYAQGAAKLNGYLDDYAFFVDGLIALHEATGEQRWLSAARELTRLQVELFWDDQDGGFYFTSHDHEALIARAKDPSDMAIPSGNSVTVQNLLYLAAAEDEPGYVSRAVETMQALLPSMRKFPGSMATLAAAMAEYLRSPAAPEPGSGNKEE